MSSGNDEPKAEGTAPDPSSGYKLTAILASLLLSGFLLLLFSYGGCITGLVFKEPDICFLLGGGRWIVEHGQIPSTDPFSYTTHYHWAQYVIEKWLCEVIFYVIYSKLTVIGLLIFDALMLGLAFVVMPYRILVRSGWRGLPALGMTLLAVLTSVSHLAVRPEVFSFVLAGIWLEVLIAVAQKTKGNTTIDWRAIGLLSVLMCLWANLHTLFLVGLIFPILYSGCIVLEQFIPSAKSSPVNWTVPILAVTCLLASLINPYGVGLWGYMPNVFGPFNNTNNEMQPIKLSTAGNPILYPFYLLTLTSFVNLLKQWRTPLQRGDLFFRLLMPMGAAAGFRTGRSIPLAGLILTAGAAQTRPQEAKSGNLFWSAVSDQVSRLTDQKLRRWSLTCMLAIVVGSYLMTYSVYPEVPQGSKAFQPPFKAIAYIEEHPPHGNLLNDPHFGAVMIWRMPHNPPVFIDPRYNLFGDNLLQDYWRMVTCKPTWKELMKKYDIGWVFLPPTLELCKKLGDDPGWQLLYSDKDSIIYQRVDKEPGKPGHKS